MESRDVISLPWTSEPHARIVHATHEVEPHLALRRAIHLEEAEPLRVTHTVELDAQDDPELLARARIETQPGQLKSR